MRGGQEEKKPPKMVRSSIACARCRRSKVKCVNNGVNSTCRACAQSNRECTYPIAGSTPTPKRAEPPTHAKQEDGGEGKKRVRKAEDNTRRNSAKVGEDPLDSPILTRQVWDELYEIFKLHFSTEMPFLHPPTFRLRMRQASYQPRDPSGDASDRGDLEEGRYLLLGVLTLTARFHPGLVAYHSPQAQDPLVASDYYADILANAFGPTVRNLTNPSLESIQALLMLGLYEWGQIRGLSAWIYVAIAVRLAQSMGLAYVDDNDSKTVYPPAQDPRRPATGQQLVSSREDATLKEVRRRTLWSCFIMDRMLAAGKYRPTMIDVEKLRVQLPCSDDQFLFVRNVSTSFLHSKWLDGTHLPSMAMNVDDDGVLSRYIRLVEIFGRFSEWSYAGGRRTEKLPPWDESTEFYKLRQQLREFHEALPSNLTFTEANLSAHIEKRNATTYASMHTLYSLCQIMLHREYIPFIPLRCQRPIGPLDEPTFPEDRYPPPPGFWEESADGIMKASRDIIDIVSNLQDCNALPESPQIGFAVYQAAFVCVYAAFFQHMDPNNRLRNDLDQYSGHRTKSFVDLTRSILSDLVPRLKMVKGYLRTINKMETYFRTTINDYVNKWKRKPTDYPGGGLEQYKVYEKELKEFGDLKDNDHNGQSDGSDTVEQTRSRASTNDPANGEAMQGIEGPTLPARPNGAWAPINASSPPENDERTKYTHGPYAYGMPYQQSPNQSSGAPSLVSGGNGNGDSTNGLNSPYTTQGPPQQQYTVQQQAKLAAQYPSIAQHTMAPPNSQMVYADDHAYEGWMKDLESIRMNAGFDGFAQEKPMDEWIREDFRVGGMGGNANGGGANYLQTIWLGQQGLAGASGGWS